jgi:hypothetical protein
MGGQIGFSISDFGLPILGIGKSRHVARYKLN